MELYHHGSDQITMSVFNDITLVLFCKGTVTRQPIANQAKIDLLRVCVFEHFNR